MWEVLVCSQMGKPVDLEMLKISLDWRVCVRIVLTLLA